MVNNLKRRCIELSFKHRLTHISSVLNTVDVLASIYRGQSKADPVVLGNSHAALALYVTLESLGRCDAEEMIAKHGTHAGRDPEHGIWVSGGSLGQCETISVGSALADRTKVVQLVTSDGALAEGCCWEAFRFASDQHLNNLRIHVIANGYGGYGEVDVAKLTALLTAIPFLHWDLYTPVIEWPWLQGLRGHYATINQEQCEAMLK